MMDISYKLNSIIKTDGLSSITAFLYLLNEKEIKKDDEQLYSNVSESNVSKQSK